MYLHLSVILFGGGGCMMSLNVSGTMFFWGSLSGREVFVRKGISVSSGSLSGGGGVSVRTDPLYGGRANGTRPTGMLSFLKINLFIPTEPQILCAWGHKIYLCFASGDHMVEKILCDHKDVFIHIIIPCFALVSWTRSPIACQQMLILIPLRRNNWHLTCLNHIYCIIHVNVRSLSSC